MVWPFQGFTHPSGAAGSGIVLYSPCKFSKAIKAEFDALGGVKGTCKRDGR